MYKKTIDQPTTRIPITVIWSLVIYVWSDLSKQDRRLEEPRAVLRIAVGCDATACHLHFHLTELLPLLMEKKSEAYC